MLLEDVQDQAILEQIDTGIVTGIEICTDKDTSEVDRLHWTGRIQAYREVLELIHGGDKMSKIKCEVTHP